MGRSAKQRKSVTRRSGLLKGGAAALGTAISENPVLVGGSTAFLVTFFFVSANALWYQPYPHTGAFFATRAIQGFSPPQIDEPETTINIERPAMPSAPPVGDPMVKQVQGILKDLNFYAGTVDGIRGPNTQKAVEAYQRKVGLTPSGEIDSLLLDQLGATPTTAAVVPQPAPRADVTDSIPPTAPATAVPGADARIVKIQAGLKAFGNDGIQLDGVVGARTSAALREFQSLFGLPVTGEADEAVYAKMREIGLTN
jgi:peptidoglycan hydrolase-like protein with peptidoglycan-binding domain